jgi:hypothetical protein
VQPGEMKDTGDMPRPPAKTRRKSTRGKQVALSALAVVAVISALSVYIVKFRWMDNASTAPGVLLEPGWQFYSRPTSLEPPGSIFRVDPQRRRFAVTEIAPETTRGSEAFGAQSLAVRTTARMLAEFLGAPGAGGQQGERIEKLEFQMFDVEKEVTTDLAIAELLDEFRSKVNYRPDNRYFIIRESRSAMGLRYALSDEMMNSLQGSAGLAQLVKGKSGLSYDKRGSYVLDQKLPARLRVMFLAEELVPAKAMTGDRPRFETAPITEPLVWQ